ncbi:hypothetical protein ACQEU3_19945 [Spirillospora sp. CA-253888]
MGRGHDHGPVTASGRHRGRLVPPAGAGHMPTDTAGVALALVAITLDALQECLAEHFDVEHCTFQLEPPGHARHELPTHA